MVATMVDNGMAGYQKMVADMEKQADLNKRVNMQLGTLKNLWDAASGTFTNTLAGFAGAMGDDLKNITKFFGDLSEKVGLFIKENPVLAQWLGRIALGFSALAIVGGAVLISLAGFGGLISLAIPAVTGLGTALGFLGTVVAVVGRAFLLNPIGLAVTAIAGAALLIYTYWGPIKNFFAELWGGIKNTFAQVIEWIGQKMQALSDGMPDWMKKYTVLGAGVQFMGEKLGPPRPDAAAQAGSNSVNGQISIKVDQDGRVSSVRASTSNSRVPISVDTGQMMMYP